MYIPHKYTQAQTMAHLYVLNDAREPVPESDLMTWALWFEDDDRRRVALDELPQGGCVSTIFLGVGHSLGGPPRLFESMVFDPMGKVLDQYRATTWAEAEALHGRMVEKHRRLL
jgi:hypothetical protein